MKKNNITAYDEKTHKGLVRHIVTRVGFKTGEIMVCLVVNGSKKNLRNLEMLVDSLTEVEGMTSICVNINKEKTNRILGSKIEEVYGKPYIYCLLYTSQEYEGLPVPSKIIIQRFLKIQFYHLYLARSRSAWRNLCREIR